MTQDGRVHPSHVDVATRSIPQMKKYIQFLSSVKYIETQKLPSNASKYDHLHNGQKSEERNTPFTVARSSNPAVWRR